MATGIAIGAGGSGANPIGQVQQHPTYPPGHSDIDAAYLYGAADMQGACFTLPNTMEFNRLSVRLGAWSGAGSARFVIWQTPTGVISKAMPIIFDELVAGSETGSANFDIPVSGGGTVTIQRGNYILGIGGGIGGTMNPYVWSFDTYLTNLINENPSGMPLIFDDLGLAADALTTIDPTVLAGDGTSNHMPIHSFRKV
jgi:hypothetical protein